MRAVEPKTNKQTKFLFIAAVGLVVITWFLIVSLVIIITTFLYWRCCCFLSSGSLIRGVLFKSIQVRAQNFSFGKGGLIIKIYVICVEFKYYVVKLCRTCKCNIGLFAAAFRGKLPIMGRFLKTAIKLG
jgi:Ni,Fe-hydrogenase I cytochrome b subunit